MIRSSLLTLAVLLAGCPSTSHPGDLRKAFEHHEKHEDPRVKAYYPQLGGSSFVSAERWKNYQKYASDCPAVFEVTQVRVGKTGDTITLSGPSYHTKPDGFEDDVCTLWLAPGKIGDTIEVRDVASY